MNPIIAFNVISKQFSKHESGLMKLEYDINASAAATVYVQIHNFPAPADLAANRTAPAAGSVPIKSWPAPAGSTNNYKEFKRGELECSNGIFVCVSTTQATLTIGTGNNKFDSVGGELLSTDIVGTEVNAQSASNVTVWTVAAGATNAHRLARISATNLEAGVRYLQVFSDEAVNLVSGTSIPFLSIRMAANGDSAGADTVLGSFAGVGNAAMWGIDFNTIVAGTKVQGCSLVISTTANVYTSTGGSGANFYAEYKT